MKRRVLGRLGQGIELITPLHVAAVRIGPANEGLGRARLHPMALFSTPNLYGVPNQCPFMEGVVAVAALRPSKVGALAIRPH